MYTDSYGYPFSSAGNWMCILNQDRTGLLGRLLSDHQQPFQYFHYGVVPAYSVKVPRVSTYSGYRHVNSSFAYGAFTLSGRLSQNRSAKFVESIMRSEPRDARIPVWALPFSLAATHRITCCFLFLRLLRCFSSPGSLPYVMDWRMDDWSLSSRVSPFRYLRIIGYLLLPEAFRSLSRLSSALSAKASTIRSYQHNQTIVVHGNELLSTHV